MMILFLKLILSLMKLTKDVSLVVFDFAEEDEVEEGKCLGKSNF